MAGPVITPLDTQPPVPGRSERKKLLVISYHFPPVGGAGVQRPVKLVKYLRQFGWDCTVLVAENPSVPVFDDSLLADIPKDTQIVKAKTWEPGYAIKQQIGGSKTQKRNKTLAALKAVGKKTVKSAATMLLQPDAQILWMPEAFKAGKRILDEQPFDAILATAPPYSNLLLGSRLKHYSNLPLILDFRDEWDLSSRYLENSQRDSLSQIVQRQMQKHVLQVADGILATTVASRNRIAEKVQQVGGSAKSLCIYNGFDPDDFKTFRDLKSPPDKKSNKFRLVYTGTLWNLTSVEPVVRAIEAIHLSKPELLSNFEFVCLGRKTPEQLEILKRLNQTQCSLKLEEYCEHKKALEVMDSADALCLLLSDVAGAERVAPAKLFEYLAIQKEILAVLPDGETADIVQRFYPQNHFLPSGVENIAQWLEARLTESTSPCTVQTSDIHEFSREHQAGQLATFLDQFVSR